MTREMTEKYIFRMAYEFIEKYRIVATNKDLTKAVEEMETLLTIGERALSNAEYQMYQSIIFAILKYLGEQLKVFAITAGQVVNAENATTTDERKDTL